MQGRSLRVSSNKNSRNGEKCKLHSDSRDTEDARAGIIPDVCFTVPVSTGTGGQISRVVLHENLPGS